MCARGRICARRAMNRCLTAMNGENSMRIACFALLGLLSATPSYAKEEAPALPTGNIISAEGRAASPYHVACMANGGIPASFNGLPVSSTLPVSQTGTPQIFSISVSPDSASDFYVTVTRKVVAGNVTTNLQTLTLRPAQSAVFHATEFQITVSFRVGDICLRKL